MKNVKIQDLTPFSINEEGGVEFDVILPGLIKMKMENQILADQKMLSVLMRFITNQSRVIMSKWAVRIIEQVRHFTFTGQR